MPKIDIAAIPERRGCPYPKPFDEPCVDRVRQRLGDAGGLKDFGVNLMRLPPGNWSAQRHWHTHEDEFVYVLEGEVVLVTDAGETVLKPGMVAGFRAGEPNGHHLRNNSNAVARVLEVGTRTKEETARYPDIGMMYREGLGYSDPDGRPLT